MNEAASQDAFEAKLIRSQELRELEIEQQARGGKHWWASFELLSGGFELHSPSWVSGYGQGPTIVFAAIAGSEEALVAHIEKFLDEGSEIDWRFIKEMEPEQSAYSDRFQGPSPFHVWPGVPLIAMDKYLSGVRSAEAERLEAESKLSMELRKLTLTELIRRAASDSTAVYEEDLDEFVDIMEDYLRRGEKLATDESA